MKKTKQKTMHVGFELLIRGQDETRMKDVWKAVGFNFTSQNEAREYREKRHPHTLPSDTRIRGVRVNIEPLTAPSAGSFNARQVN